MNMVNVSAGQFKFSVLLSPLTDGKVINMECAEK